MIMMTDIVREGDPVLRKKASDVVLPASIEDKETLASLMEYVQNSQDPELMEKYGLRPGIGLAAPQIGISKRMIAIHLKDEKGSQVSYALFNPKIISHSVEKTFLTSGEGCLSVDRDVPGYVHRYARVTVKATTLEGEEIKIRLKGLPAVCIQHEIDHLNGIMFYDYINEKDPFHIEENAQSIER
ncbi:peptide deformylase [Domibacillus iocasae]|jgi:peptide deformylase|uniref:Peptide deformylase n=1 Tax=Domibacillus iocasae TaxID=1714016 RepID=A0A1E7DKY7_9BACI|nr:peptide deformylase [Domibacillus iocasae]OES43746.1 peptide deformylase [Domibacillus iocasae]